MNHERILLDIETQRDFFDPSCGCYRREASDVARNIYKLFDWAQTYRIPVISTLLRVRPGERGPLLDKPHCVEGTDGEMKLSRTLLPHRIDLGLRNVTDLPDNLFERYQQAIFEKRDTDIFAHARLERLLTEIPPATFIVCGAGTGLPIAQAVVGLRNRGFSVVIASDAVLDVNESKAEMAHLRMEAKGAVYCPTAEITVPPARRRRKARSANAILAESWRE